MDRITNNRTDQERIRVMQALGELRKEVDDEELQEYYKMLMMTAGFGTGLVSCQRYVRAFNEQEQVEIKPNGIFHKGELVRNHRAFFYRLHESWKEYRKVHDLKENFRREEVALEFEAIQEDHWKTKVEDLREKLRPEPDMAQFDQMLDQVVWAMCGHRVVDRDDIEFRRNKGFLAHFMWQLQMKLHKGPETILRAGNESTLLLISQQQKSGKSTTVRYLLAPILDAGFVWKSDFARLEDNFSLHNLAYNYVGWFDDAARASSKNMERFKQVVTDDEVNFRAMWSQTEMRMPKLATLIGTSNKDASELFHDTSGLRRFHQIFVNNSSVDTGRGIDLDFISQFDFTKMYKCITINNETPMFRYITQAELNTYEQQIRPKHVVELWVDDTKYEPGNVGDTVKLHTELYDEFRVWASRNGYGGKYMPNMTSFKHKMQIAGFEKGRNNKGWGFYVSGV